MTLIEESFKTFLEEEATEAKDPALFKTGEESNSFYGLSLIEEKDSLDSFEV